MKLSLTKVLVITASLSLFAAVGIRAQDQNPDPVAQRKVLTDWILPHKGPVFDKWSNDSQGTIYFEDFETEQPYAKTLRFYATMCKLKGNLDNLSKAATKGTGGSYGMSSDGVSFSSANRPHVLASTFIGIYTDHTVTVNLTCPVNGTLTHVTITRVNLPTQKP